MQYFILHFDRERPARWAMHVLRNIAEELPPESMLSLWRGRLEVTAVFCDGLLDEIDIHNPNDLFHRVCFAYALRYPHIHFRIKGLHHSDEKTGCWQDTWAEYRDGLLRVTQMRFDPSDQYKGKYAFNFSADWRKTGDTFVPEEPKPEE